MIAFVTDGDQRPALAIVRSLGRRGMTVIVGEERPTSLASTSRYCARHVTYPSPYRDPDAFDRFLQDFLARQPVDVVLPVTDVTTHAVAREQDAIRRRAALSVPRFEAFDFVADKARLLQQAARCGIPIPRTVFVENVAAISGLASRIDYPAVVKPARSRIRTDRGWLAASVRYAHSESELRALYERHEELARYPSLIQARVSGPGLGVFALCDRGELRTTFAHVRLREKPPSGGVSVLSESTAVDPILRAQARRLLGSLAWHGVAMLEYKHDLRRGQSVLMEVNGRFWGSLQLAVDAGVDFPYLSAQLALDQPLDLPAGYRTGVRSRWWLGDVDHLLLRLRRGARDLPEDAPSRLGSAIAFLTPARGQRSEIFRWHDPRPALHELARYVGDLGSGAGTAARAGRARPIHRDAPAGVPQKRSSYVRSFR